MGARRAAEESEKRPGRPSEGVKSRRQVKAAEAAEDAGGKK